MNGSHMFTVFVIYNGAIEKTIPFKDMDKALDEAYNQCQQIKAEISKEPVQLLDVEVAVYSKAIGHDIYNIKFGIEELMEEQVADAIGGN